MTNKEKLEAVKRFLVENRIEFYPLYRGRIKVSPDLYVPKHKIMVKISEGKEKDDNFYHAVKYKYHPLFIRDDETKDFVLEKMQNLIIDIMQQKQKCHNRKNRK